jgi:hypothetical protein
MELRLRPSSSYRPNAFSTQYIDRPMPFPTQYHPTTRRAALLHTPHHPLLFTPLHSSTTTRCSTREEPPPPNTYRSKFLNLLQSPLPLRHRRCVDLFGYISYFWSANVLLILSRYHERRLEMALHPPTNERSPKHMALSWTNALPTIYCFVDECRHKRSYS